MTKTLTDRIQALTAALALQRALANPALHEQERKLAKGSPKKMKNFGYRPAGWHWLSERAVPERGEMTCKEWPVP